MNAPQKPEDGLEVLLDSFLAELMQMPDEQVLDGVDPATVQSKGLSLLSEAKQQAGRRRLAAAKAAVVLARADRRVEDVKSFSAEEAREGLREAANSSRFTLAARGLDEMSDNDAIRVYDRLVRIGSVPATGSQPPAMDPAQRAEARIAELGIRDPRDIDVEAIAADAQMTVEYEALDSCEATLVGVDHRAIATIKPSKIRGRERFSVGHELGHWELHRGSSFKCWVDDPDKTLASDRSREKEADEYAAHLLMPSALFNPAVRSLGSPGFREIDHLTGVFRTSLLATSLRLADVGLPVIVACYSQHGLRWSKFAANIPRRWWLHRKVDHDTFSGDLFATGHSTSSVCKRPANAWFENDDAFRYEVTEDCIPGGPGEVLVLLYLTSSMLTAGFDPNVGVRRLNEFGSNVKRR